MLLSIAGHPLLCVRHPPCREYVEPEDEFDMNPRPQDEQQAGGEQQVASASRQASQSTCVDWKDFVSAMFC